MTYDSLTQGWYPGFKGVCRAIIGPLSLDEDVYFIFVLQDFLVGPLGFPFAAVFLMPLLFLRHSLEGIDLIQDEAF